jgi:hypothetical protein
MSSLEDQVQLLLEKVDRILTLLESSPSRTAQPSARTGTRKAKRLPPSADDIALRQERFEKLYEAWDAGEELRVETELNAMLADELRQFADANNLNVTSKTSKAKVMQLIAGRFRERRQLTRSHFNRPSSTD